MKYRLTSLQDVLEAGSWLFTVVDTEGNEREVFLLPCEEGDEPSVRAWVNRCTHEDQRLYRDDVGVITRNGHIICPKHGSSFDTCSGLCDNGPAADTTLWSVDTTVEDGAVYLTDADYRFRQTGGRDDGGDTPGSSSHLRF